jgi:hypothetical protein
MFPVREGRLTNKVIILDLDHTLICTLNDSTQEIYNKATRSQRGIAASFSPFDIPLIDITMPGRAGTGNVNIMKTIFRPHYREFLEWCNTYFSYVIIYTAAIDEYARDVVKSLYYGMKGPDYIFSREDCSKDDEDKYYKPLEKLFQDNPFLLSICNLQNTLIVDDTSSTYRDNISNAIPIPGYLKKNFSVGSLMQDDETLLLIKQWFLQKEIIRSTDLRVHNKKAIFSMSLSDLKKTEAILPASGPYIFSSTK